MDIQAVLSEAARAIKADGWTTVAARQREDERLSWSPAGWTLVEAVEYVVPNDGETERRVLDVLRARAGTDDLDGWNEAPDRTIEDVLGLLNSSVDLVEAAGGEQNVPAYLRMEAKQRAADLTEHDCGYSFAAHMHPTESGEGKAWACPAAAEARPDADRAAVLTEAIDKIEALYQWADDRSNSGHGTHDFTATDAETFDQAADGIRTLRNAVHHIAAASTAVGRDVR